MSQSTAEQMRQWRGPAILSFGFRPMFSLAALWAAGAMALWVSMLSGLLTLPMRFDPVTWHAHEFLFGYLGAVIGGFLLTAVPNWTGRLPVVGWHLGGLAALWMMGRLAIAMSTYLPGWGVAILDISFLLVLSLVVLREIFAGKNWSNLPVLALVGVMTFSNILFHIETAQNGFSTNGFSLRLGLAVGLVLMTLIGGKIIPSFTRNWLVKRNAAILPAPPMQRFDKATVIATILTLLGWCAAPTDMLTGAALLVLSGLHLVRLSRWQGVQTLAEPLVWVLHIAYAFIPLGALAMSAAILAPDVIAHATAVHVWTVGAVGLMSVAVMTRATRGHAGHTLTADRTTVAIYLALIGSVGFRVAADILPSMRAVLLNTSASLWIICFAGFFAVYGPMLLRPKKETAE